jgi:hypothetical protein
VHLSALVGVPAAVVLATRRQGGGWRLASALLLGGAMVMAAGVGRVSGALFLVGAALSLAGAVRLGRDEGRGVRVAPLALALAAIGASALLVLLLRARHDPALNQGNPATWTALTDVVARRQYAVAELWPRQAPVWLQLANVAQYADWQPALGWGRGVFTTAARVIATVAFAVLALVGARSLRRDASRLADALLVLLACGTLGVAAYLNLKAGASLGWGVIPDEAPHEARERDYFFVLGFWAWGCLAGYGALELVRRRRWPAPLAVAVALVPLLANWRVSDRSAEPRASAARALATGLLGSTPEGAVLFTGGDNDSYPLWYAQQVESFRSDVTVITLSLLPADWYRAELARRTGLRWVGEPVPGAQWRHEMAAAQLAAAARRTGRPVVASPTLTPRERALLGGGWRLEGLVYRSHAAATGAVEAATVDTLSTAAWARRAPAYPASEAARVDNVAAQMAEYLACPLLRSADLPHRDSLEVRCNLR